MTDLEKAELDLKNFLISNPEMQPVQEKINRILKNSIKKEDRIVLLNELILESTEKLKEEFILIQEDLNKLYDMLGDFKK